MARQGDQRFEIIAEPTGAWMIWDAAQDFPAELGDIVFIGLSRSTAKEMADLLNGAVADKPIATGTSANRCVMDFEPSRLRNR